LAVHVSPSLPPIVADDGRNAGGRVEIPILKRISGSGH